MKTATALTLVAIGAILAFAVTAQPHFFSFHMAGWVLIVVGLLGTVLPRRGRSSVRRHLELSGVGRPRVIDRRQRPLASLLEPSRLITEQPDVGPENVAVERETIDQLMAE